MNHCQVPWHWFSSLAHINFTAPEDSWALAEQDGFTGLQKTVFLAFKTCTSDRSVLVVHWLTEVPLAGIRGMQQEDVSAQIRLGRVNQTQLLEPDRKC